MKIERVDDKTVKCFLSNEELEEYEIDYKDFIMRSEKAKELVQEIIEQASQEVGYKPPRFAFDLQIMMVPDHGLVLTFSEKDPLDNLGAKDGEQLVECLNEMKKILQKSKEKLQQQADVGQAGSEKAIAKKSAEEQLRPDFAIFAFRSLGRVMEYAKVLPATLRVQSALYEMDGIFYLHMHKGAASYERYSRACIQAMEFASLYSAEEDVLVHLQECGECLIAEKALKKLS